MNNEKDILPAAAASSRPCETGPRFRRQWRPIAAEGAHQEYAWTTFDEVEVNKARASYPWMKFQSRLISDWADEGEQGALASVPPQAEKDVCGAPQGEGE